jgi:hypothetical protein
MHQRRRRWRKSSGGNEKAISAWLALRGSLSKKPPQWQRQYVAYIETIKRKWHKAICGALYRRNNGAQRNGYGMAHRNNGIAASASAANGGDGGISENGENENIVKKKKALSMA